MEMQFHLHGGREMRAGELMLPNVPHDTRVPGKWVPGDWDAVFSTPLTSSLQQKNLNKSLTGAGGKIWVVKSAEKRKILKSNNPKKPASCHPTFLHHWEVLNFMHLWLTGWWIP